MKKFYKKEGFTLAKFVVSIEETLVQEFEVESENIEDALETAKTNYNKGEFVLCSGEVQYKRMAIVEPDEDKTEWFEF